MLAVWVLVGRGDVVNAETRETNWSIDWPALQTLLLVRHDVVSADPPDEIVDAMFAIRRELQRPATDLLMPSALD